MMNRRDKSACESETRVQCHEANISTRGCKEKAYPTLLSSECSIYLETKYVTGNREIESNAENCVCTAQQGTKVN